MSLSEISRRLLFRYYPLVLLSTTLYVAFLAQKQIWPTQSALHGMNLFILINIQLLFSYGFTIMPLYLFKPSHFISRFILMTIFMILSVGIFYFLTHKQGASPLMGRSLVKYALLKMVSGSFFVMWLFFIAEKALIAEKTLKEEDLKRISNEKMLVENRLRLLQAQIEPQFLFNTLTSIINLRDLDLEKAKKMQMYFIQYLRATLLKTRATETTVRQEMELIRAYLEIEKIRMEDRMAYDIDIESDVEDMPFPSMLIQPIVENAIIHGIEKMPDGGKITLVAQKNGGFLKVSVADTGLGRSEKIETAGGLVIVKQRLESLFSTGGHMRIENNNPSGIRVIIEFPNE